MRPGPLWGPALAKLVVAAGAGAASRQAIGTAVVGGMIAATVMSVMFTPVFYVVMQRLSEIGKKMRGKVKKPQTKAEDREGQTLQEGGPSGHLIRTPKTVLNSRQ